MTIPPRFLDEIRDRLALSDIIGKRVKVTRAGREFKACCPFHHEKTPSFTINDDKQFYHCFGCGAHGDVIGFVMRHDNRSFPEAVEMLAVEAGLQVPQQSPQEIEKAKKQKDLYSLLEEATLYQEKVLHSPKEAAGKEALQYLLDRGIKPETIRAFRIGYSPADGQLLRKYLAGKGYTDAQMIEAGVLRRSDKGREPYAFFRERIMFPVSDRRGRVVAFGGRILPEHLRPPERGDFKPPKYINSSETPVFHKSRILYGESLARQATSDGKPLIVVEGYMDVIACHQAGFQGAVAPMGTALTEEQILLLWKMIPAPEKVPVLCFDGDNAGRRAAARAAENILPLLGANKSVRLAFLPDGEDPDTLLRAGGKSAFEKILGGAMSLFDFIWASHTAGRRFETPESRAGVVKALQNEVKAIADREVQKHYQELIQSKISETFFARPYQKKGRQAGRRPSALRPRTPVLRTGNMYPRILVAAVLNHPHIYEEVEEPFGHFETGDNSLDRLRQAVIASMSDDPALDRQALQNHLKQNGLEREIDDILSESVYVHAAFSGPSADPAAVAAKWLAFWQAVQGKVLEKEIQTGWKDALQSSSEEKEEKLRNMMRVRASEEAG